MIKTYQRKPKKVRAVQVKHEDLSEILEFMEEGGMHITKYAIEHSAVDGSFRIRFNSAKFNGEEQQYMAMAGDYIVKGEENAYAVSQRTFESNYTEVGQ